jgi:N-methylhydantoinase A
LLLDDAMGATFRVKTQTTPGNQAAAGLDGIQRVCSIAGVGPSALAELMHGTTVATNALLESKGARVGLIVTEGYRQILQVARSYVPGGLAGWIVWPKPEPLAALDDTVEVPQRIGARGELVREFNEVAVRQALRTLVDRGVEAITLALINSYVNPAHERRIRELAAEEVPNLPLSLSGDILPEMREYERTITTVANSYVRPTVARYLKRLHHDLKARRIDAQLKLLRSDGGLMPFEAAESAPVNMLLSGPAGGVAGALWVARHAGFSNVLTLDMGGTSTDACLIENGAPRVRRETTVGNLTVRVSSLDVRTVGAGGWSIAKVPALTRALRVGPESAGADPGPPAYGRGGEAATVTDANIVLGRLLEVSLARNRRAMAELIKRSIPEEEPVFEDYVCDDGRGFGPYKIRCSLKRYGDRVKLDWSGTDPQSDGPINFYLNENMLRMFFGIYMIMVFDPQILYNDGFYDLVDVHIIEWPSGPSPEGRPGMPPKLI